ncbi:S-layer homology domain-containing protein [Patescibacteria group bacterium]
MKKTLMLILVGALLGSTVAFAASKFFSDVPADTWYSEAVASLSDKGIIEGYEDGTFGPTNNVNRAELAVMLDRLIDYMETSEVTSSNLCTASPTTTDIGRDIYPIDPKYSNIGFLGQLFTAYTCGSERVSQLFGVDGDNYTLGSTILLVDYPSQSLIDTLDSIGFSCHESNSDELCKEWQLWETVTIDDMMMLEPYYQNFEGDDCTNCG